MKALDTKLRHIAFFEELSSLSADSAEWRKATAGLITLRLVDAWLEDGPQIACDEWTFHQVRKAVDDVDEGTPIRAMLLRVVDAVGDKKASIEALVTPLMAYGQALEFDAAWPLAADVYRSVLARLHPIENGDASIAAYLRLAACYRHLNMMDDALVAFGEVSAIGAVTGDMVGVLRGRLGEAQVAWLRGNLPRAETILDETIGRASTPELADVRSRALHDRSSVAILRGEFELAVRLAYQALGTSQNANERDKILHNIAGAFASLGVYSAARDAYLVLSATAQEQYLRWAATLNLLEISSLTGTEPLFEQYRRQLVGENLPPQLATSFQLMLGQGYQRLGGREKARGYLQRAVELAAEHGFSQLLFEAEQSLQTVAAPSSTQQKVEHVPLDLEEVVEAIRGLRKTAGAA